MPEKDKGDHADDSRNANRHKVGFLHAAILFCPIVETNDRLQALGNTDDKCHDDHGYLGDDTGAGDRDRLAVDGQTAVVFKGTVEHDLYQHHCQLVKVKVPRQAIQPKGRPLPLAKSVPMQWHSLIM